MPQSADSKTLRRAFHSLSKTLHPDTTSLPAEEAAYRFQQICEAYELLTDPLQRVAYDERLKSVNMRKQAPTDELLDLSKNISTNFKAMEVRRSFSGGEMFSLLLLVGTLLISLLLAIGFAYIQGRALQIQPSWLIYEERAINVIASLHHYLPITTN